MGCNKILIHLSIACYVLCIVSQKHSDSCQYTALNDNSILHYKLQAVLSYRRLTMRFLTLFLNCPLFFFYPDVPAKLNRPCQKWMRRMACCREACRSD